MLWLKRWNFIERARLERELWDAFEAGDDIEAMVEQLRSSLAEAPAATPAAADGSFRLEVWETTRVRIRRIETLMKDRAPAPPPKAPLR
ncbi:hypothetical protein KBZ18_14100 [Synechococcus sp. Cruz-9H2]|uniref:hypothetical protein n=1 Tax=unclassified Synechococcus TaxID=2626047 RepID=UPI0020CBC568|nr:MULTISPECIES: hypothetical protein [unclassified Synechococcus]MCP9820617.1 hypothetical protein [Synechococcus sp. Cruz-9H2]MCP9844873.1 hypothetical protein [Synechococcus sp. Edmonson 11F2]MCP9856994.1 hypothetical protein [Synechococcus sp. Cruz-9C9]MCP9864281.1 hypothetical protein [Synechococcus sp. Cruz-7E5]MCP9871549.1 hypothetical protein [Synechococcus sp. Cruz-7B9]